MFTLPLFLNYEVIPCVSPSGFSRIVLILAIGMAPKNMIFKKYTEIELQFGNIDRCRKLYEKYFEWSPENCYAWSQYAELERSLSETNIARAIFELAIAQPALDMPELLWKLLTFDTKLQKGKKERPGQLLTFDTKQLLHPMRIEPSSPGQPQAHAHASFKLKLRRADDQGQSSRKLMPMRFLSSSLGK
ncbi:hypothetical protein POM88_048960 [Heracleum sosnowskyi]|uniref:Uncharacterized protein n=1 Tax=Heracleum sosnowskyi TaxID=360622 RepID=A0AAD8GW74_9APIA|nr:hypothetical protein POM88_048960 [Heracleum sosnowskyi]